MALKFVVRFERDVYWGTCGLMYLCLCGGLAGVSFISIGPNLSI